MVNLEPGDVITFTPEGRKYKYKETIKDSNGYYHNFYYIPDNNWAGMLYDYRLKQEIENGYIVFTADRYRKLKGYLNQMYSNLEASNILNV